MPLETAFAFLDAQFFYVNNEPRVRELAVLSEACEGVYEFDPNITEGLLSPEDHQRNNDIRYNILGLPFTPVRLTFGLPILTQNDFIPLLKQIVNRLSHGNRVCFAINNKILENILIANNIQFTTMWNNDEIVSNNHWVCAHHTEHLPENISKPRIKCALRICYDMFNDYLSSFQNKANAVRISG